MNMGGLKMEYKGPVINDNGITVRELKEFIKDWPETDPETGEDYEVWIDTGNGTSNVAEELWRLNKGDILISIQEYEHQSA